MCPPTSLRTGLTSSRSLPRERQRSGFRALTSAEFAVTVQQAYELPDVSLSVATANTVVMVRPTDLIAAEQIKAQEKQRLIRVIPNFCTSYIYDAAPLTSKQKFSLAARGTFGPVALIGVAFGASIEQANNSFAAGRSGDFLTQCGLPCALSPGSALLLPGLRLG